jgi:cytoskeletal protein CcmA (bactofilin family)
LNLAYSESIMPTARRYVLMGAIVGVAVVQLLDPSQACAAEFRYDKDGTVRVDAAESIDDTVFLSGKTVIVAGVVDGDVFAAAERVEVKGTVRGNIYVAGESVTIAGQVGGNVHAAGKDLELEAKVGGSGFLAARNLILTEGSELARGGYLACESVQSKGRIGRDLYFAASTVDLSGTVEREVRGYARRVTVSSSSSLAGDIHVTVPSEDALEVAEGATVSGETIVDVHVEEEDRPFRRPGFYFGVVAQTLALLLLGIVLATLFPSLLPPAPKSSREVLRDMGIGLVALVATPIVMLLIALTVIGIPVSILLGMVYAVLVFVSTLVVAYLVGQRLPIQNDRPVRVVLRTGLSLLVILFAVGIPFIGPGLRFLIHIFGMGCLLVHLRNRYTARRGLADLPAEASSA